MIKRVVTPTRKFALLFTAAALIGMVIIGGWEEWWYVALYLPTVLFVLLLIDFVLSSQRGAFTIGVKSPALLFIGQKGEVEIDIRGDSDSDFEIELILECEGDLATLEPVNGYMEDGKLIVNITISPTRRGAIHLSELWIRYWGFLGFTEFKLVHGVYKKIPVVHNIRGIHDAAIQFFTRDAIYGVKTQQKRGGGVEFDSLREYVAGMDYRFIDWKHSAKHRKLLCKEFIEERNNHIVLGYDTGSLMLESIDEMPKLDHAIKAGLLLSFISLRNGDLIGGCSFDAKFRNYVKPGSGMTYFAQLQRFTADIEYRAEETNFTLGLTELNSRLNRRSLIVLFTDFVDHISAELLLESLQLVVRRHVIVFVTLRDPLTQQLKNKLPKNFINIAEAVTANDFEKERSIVLERIARLGIHCIDTNADQMSVALLNKYLLIKQRGLI